MIAARAVVTERGGSTSHAAVVTRALGRPSVVGVGEGVTAELAGRELTVDGSAGVVYAGLLPTEDVDPAEVPGLDELIEWARELSPVEVVDEAPGGALDLDAAGAALDEGAPDVARSTERLRGADRRARIGAGDARRARGPSLQRRRRDGGEASGTARGGAAAAARPGAMLSRSDHEEER